MKIVKKISFAFFLTLTFFFYSNAQQLNNSLKENTKDRLEKYICTFFGGTKGEVCVAIVLDENENVYVTGHTSSLDFPVTPNAYNNVPKGKDDVFIMKLDRDLKTVISSTIIGGSDDETTCSIIYDGQGYIYVAGYTSSCDFPTTRSSYCPKYNGGDGDAFIIKIDNNLSTIAASTFLGGSGTETGWLDPVIVLDKEGNLFIAGCTLSQDFPTTKGAYCKKLNSSSRDCFISKIDNRFEKLIYSTLLGGSDYDRVQDMKIDKKTNEVCVVGFTYSIDFPTTKKVHRKNINGYEDGFITKLSMNLSKITSSTILDRAIICALFFHDNGDIYVGGHAKIGFPSTSKAYYRNFDLHFDQGFITRFSNDLNEIKSSTLLPGSFPTGGGGIICLNLAQTSDGNIISSGWTQSKNFPSTPGTFDETHNGGGEFGSDTYIMVMRKDLSKIITSTFIGGKNDERWNKMTLDKNGNIYIASYTSSEDFPTTKGSAYNNFKGGEYDGFIFRINKNLSADIYEEFHDVVKHDNLKKVKQLLRGNNELSEKVDIYKRTALHSAVRYGSESVCKYLIEQGAN